MEPNDEIRIREKVRLAEEIPQAWNRDHVWSAIFRHERQPRRSMAFYYAAASLILAAALIFYSRELTYREELNVKIRGIELTIAQTQQHVESTTAVHQAAVLLTECPDPPAAEVSKPLKVKPENSMIARAEKAETIQQPGYQEDIELPKEVETQSNEQPAAEVQSLTPTLGTPTQAQVQPIIGSLAGIPSTTKNKRFQLRLFQGDEEVKSSPTAAPMTTLASINNR